MEGSSVAVAPPADGALTAAGSAGERPGDGGAAAWKAPERLKELVVPAFGSEHSLGELPTRLHSDLRHFVEMLRRGKQPRLAEARLTAMEEALAASGTGVASLGQLRATVEQWRLQGRRAFDADKYYDQSRASGYTEHNRGSQTALAQRALQLASVATTGDGDAPPLLALDLGCGSGLSTAAAASCKGLHVLGLDLSSEMLREDTWRELAEAGTPMAGERLRCDLAQGLPLRKGTVDLAYSVAAVHYLAQASETRSAEQRLGSFLRDLRSCLADGTRPCALQAFLSKEPGAVDLFREQAQGAGWALCDLVVDKAHGSKGAEREFLYLLAEHKAVGPLERPARCPLYRHCRASCALALEAWALARDAAPVRLDEAHRAWLLREHDRYARRLLRLRGRGSEAAGDGLDEEECCLAEALAPVMSAGPSEEGEDAMAARIVELLHKYKGSGP